MNTVKGIYKSGVIELIEKPDFQEPVEVLIIFPAKAKIVKSIGGRFKGGVVDYDKMDTALKELSRQSEEHLLRELENGK